MTHPRAKRPIAKRTRAVMTISGITLQTCTINLSIHEGSIAIFKKKTTQMRVVKAVLGAEKY